MCVCVCVCVCVLYKFQYITHVHFYKIKKNTSMLILMHLITLFRVMNPKFPMRSIIHVHKPRGHPKIMKNGQYVNIHNGKGY